MAGTLTTFAKDKILNTWYRSDSAYKPSAVYVGLFTADPTDAGTLTNEVSGGSYARQQITQANGSWNAPADASGKRRITNVNAVTFPTASANWGTITHAALIDASSSGNMLIVIPLDASKTINNGDSFSFPATNLKIDGD